MREEPQRIAGRLEGTLRIPDRPPVAVAIVAHPLPTHGGTMRNPLVAAIARACADRGIAAVRFNFRGVGASAGEWTGGLQEPDDVADAAAHARAAVPGVPLAAVGYSFGALMTLRWIERGAGPLPRHARPAASLTGAPAPGAPAPGADALALVGLPLRSVSLAPNEMPPVPDGTFIVAAGADQFGTAAEIRAAYPRARVREVPGVDHFFGRRHGEVGAIVAAQLAQDLRVP